MDAAPDPDVQAVLPPEPGRRFVSPAPEEFAGSTPPGAWVWPLLWCALAALLVAVL